MMELVFLECVIKQTTEMQAFRVKKFAEGPTMTSVLNTEKQCKMKFLTGHLTNQFCKTTARFHINHCKATGEATCKLNPLPYVDGYEIFCVT